jgi:DNA-binding response OmpR family regulator
MATVLVAEDDRDILALMVHKLERSGHRVLSATNGLSALAMARDECPDLALVDVGMPGMTGLDVCRALRASPETAGLPVILVTVHASAAAVDEGFSAGADDYVVKPFSPSHLVSRVEAVLGRFRTWEQAGLLACVAARAVRESRRARRPLSSAEGTAAEAC